MSESTTPNELILTESRTAREQYGNRIDVLEKVRAIPFLPDNLHVTTEGAAAFFDTDSKTIEKVAERHRAELESSGFRVVEGRELTDIKSVCGIQSRARSLALFNRRSLLNIAMLLRDSEVARAVRRHLLDSEATLRAIEAEALSRRSLGDPITWTWDEATAIAQQRYGIPWGPVQWRRKLRAAGVLQQAGGPKAKYKRMFWFTGSAWEIHAHAVPELIRLAVETDEQLRAFQGIQIRLELEGVGRAALEGGAA